jgi:hypothetical protein
MSGPRSYPTQRTRVSLFVWHFPLKLSDLSGPTSTLAVTHTAILYLLVRIKLIHDRTDIHIVVFFFQKMDLNKDGVVTLEEFLDSCMSDEDISQSMAVFDSAF